MVGVPPSYAPLGGFAIGARVSLLGQHNSRTRNVSDCLYSLYAWFVFSRYKMFITDRFSGPGRAIVPVCVCVCVSGQ